MKETRKNTFRGGPGPPSSPLLSSSSPNSSARAASFPPLCPSGRPTLQKSLSQHRRSGPTALSAICFGTVCQTSSTHAPGRPEQGIWPQGATWTGARRRHTSACPSRSSFTCFEDTARTLHGKKRSGSTSQPTLSLCCAGAGRRGPCTRSGQTINPCRPVNLGAFMFFL